MRLGRQLRGWNVTFFISLCDWVRIPFCGWVSISFSFTDCDSGWSVDPRFSSDYYKKEIQQFEVDVKQFYEYGRTIFLASKSGEIGSLETSYSHILRFNWAKLAQITYTRHKVSIGVFTLQFQGYEKRRNNKESKKSFSKTL